MALLIINAINILMTKHEKQIWLDRLVSNEKKIAAYFRYYILHISQSV